MKKIDLFFPIPALLILSPAPAPLSQGLILSQRGTLPGMNVPPGSPVLFVGACLTAAQADAPFQLTLPS
jgi:hypothetical protein